MFTHLFDSFVSGVSAMPGVLVYAAVGLWVGAENVGIPLPLELMLLFSGSLVALSELNIAVVLFTIVLVALAFAMLAYLIGRHAGAAGVLRVGRYVGLSEQRIDHIDTWLRHRGAPGVVLARIFPGIRLFSSYVMGVADIPPVTFIVGALIGTASYFSIWVIIGEILGPNYRVPLRYLDRLGVYGIILVVALIAAAFLVHRFWGGRNLRVLAQQHAQHKAALTSMGSAIPAAMPGAALALSGLNGLESSQEPSVASGSTHSSLYSSGAPSLVRRWSQMLPTPHERIPALHETRQAMRVAAARLWPTWLARTLAGSWAAVLVLFLLLGAAAHGSPAFPIDLSLSQQLHPLGDTLIGRPMTFLGDLQGPVGAAVAYVIVLTILAICRFIREAICLAVSGLGAETSNIVVNGVVARPRPAGDVSRTLANLGAHSFPSGHTANCVGLYGFLFYLVTLALGAQPARSRWRPWLIAVQVICALFILDVGISRVVEGQHWPSDVAGGYLLGGLFLVIGIVLYHMLAEREAGVAPHGVMPLVVARAQPVLQPVWARVSTATEHALREAETLDHRVAEDVGLHGPDLQTQVRAPWPSWVIVLVSAGWAELATIVLLLSVSAHRYATFPIDESLTTAIQHLRGTVWAALIYPAGDLQWYLPTAIAYLIIFGTLLTLRLYLAAIFTAISSFGTDLVNVTINAIVNRPRPHGVTIATLTGGNLGRASFPSGHVAHTVGLYGFVFFLCILAMRAQPRLKPWLLAIQAICVYFIVFVGISRILEGQHWPSDVLGGYLVGASVLTLVIVLYHVVAMRPHTQPATAVAAPTVEPAIDADIQAGITGL